ncbi:DUF4232 domain-containing protein [Streptomyces sp. NPDC050264]|uniref:DUF4232 domain-containing protein n=1 Tax=Streptomyces sp. NPDC050264 TaxID=3155038 RepID=UPI00344A1CCC
MTIRGRASLRRAAGLVVTALLVAACGTQTSGTGGPAAKGAADPDHWRVHADSLETGTPAPYGSVDVPTSSRPAEPTGPCPDSGMRIQEGRGDAAMGLRVVDLTLTNCGRATFELYGYPRLRLIEEDRSPVERVRVLEGADDITTGIRDDGARRVSLRPGEAAVTLLVWRNTYDDTTHPPVTVERVTIDPGLGRGTPTLALDQPLDLGSTGRLGTTAWRKS